MDPIVVQSPKNKDKDISSEAAFSHCGRYLAIYSRGQPWPELVPLQNLLGPRSVIKRQLSSEETTAYSKRRKEAFSNEEEDEVMWSGIEDELVYDMQLGSAHTRQLSTTQSHERQSLLVPPVTTLNSSTVVVSGHTMTTCNITSNEVQIHSKKGTQETRTPVVKLPQVIPTRGISAQVSAPEPDDDPQLYKVIVNATPSRPYLSTLPSASQHLPIIIWKDERALIPHTRPVASAQLSLGQGPAEIGEPLDVGSNPTEMEF
jgi:hypothetical protein